MIQGTVPAFPKLLPGDVYTEVCVRHRNSENLAVIPVVNLHELEQFSDLLQTEAVRATPITPAITKCLALCPQTNLWCRGRVVQLEPLHVKFVDIGVIQVCNPANLREISSNLASVAPFAIWILPKDGIPKRLIEKDTFSVKPLYKHKTGCWVVDIDVSAAKEEEIQADSTSIKSEDSNIPSGSCQISSAPLFPEPSQQTETVVPDILNQDYFTTVIITHMETENVNGDVYYVGNKSMLKALKSMSVYFSGAVKNILVSPKIGDIGLKMYSGLWYRVKVIGLTPLTVLYIDEGPTETLTNTEALYICPDSHKDLNPLVIKIKLESGTSQQFCNRHCLSEISIKPVSTLSDGTVLVQVDHQEFNEVNNQVETEHEKSNNALSPALIPRSLVTHCQEGHSEPEHLLDLIGKKVDCSMVQFIPQSIDVARNIVFGTIFTEDFPESQTIAIDDGFGDLLEKEPSDTNFTPKDGDLVVFKTDEWHRAKVLELQGERWLSVVDKGSIVKYEQCKPLPEQYIKYPLLGAVIRLSPPVDFEHLQQIKGELDIPVSLINIGPVSCSVELQMKDLIIKAEMEKWNFDPLTWPLPLPSGTLVNVTKVLKSNLFVVVPMDNQILMQTIQIENNFQRTKSTEHMSPPEIGDYVSFLNEDNIYYRTRVESIDSINNCYNIISIDEWNTFEAKIDSLYPMPAALYKAPHRATPVILKGVDDCDLTDFAKLYISTLVEQGRPLRIEHDEELGFVTLTINDNEENINEKLEKLLNYEIPSDANGKFSLSESIKEETITPLHEEVTFVVVHTHPLYIQNLHLSKKYSVLHISIAEYANKVTSLYNPSNNELCLVQYEGEWYRAVCIEERNTGVNKVMLLDYGNVLEMPTINIRCILPEFLRLPIIGIHCTITGLPEEVTPKLQARLDELVCENSIHKGILDATDGFYYIKLPNVLTTLKVEGLIP